MGNVSSRADDHSPIYLRDQNRLAVSCVKITNSRNRILYTITPNAFPATRYTVRKEPEDETIIEYVQDPEVPSAGTLPSLLLRLNNDEEIIFYFTFAMRQSASSVPLVTSPDWALPDTTSVTDTTINSLTFAFAPTPKDLDTLVTREFNADPNLHKNPNVDLVGDYNTAGNAREQFEWSWKWRPPKMTEDKGGGWRNTCSFVEYDQRGHRLNSLVTFSFWVHNILRRISSPKPRSPRMELSIPHRFRIPSNQSADSRMSDSDNDFRECREPASPIAVIPETDWALQPTTTNDTVKVDINCQRPASDVSAVDDGPVFRATMKALEQKTSNVRVKMKKVLRKAEAAKEAQVVCNYSIQAFMEALREASSSNANAVQPALDHYFEKIAKDILLYEKQNAESLQKLIIEPIAKLYSNDIKQAEAKKKDFDEESKDYYAYASRYLGQRQDSKEKKQRESDSKYQSKRLTFELKRFDYSSFMQDLHGGRKDQEVLSQLTKYADAQARGFLATAKKIEAMIPQLEALCFEVNEANKEYDLQRTGREEKRRALEKTSKTYSDAESMGVASPASVALSLTNGPRLYASVDVDAGPTNGEPPTEAERSNSKKIGHGVPTSIPTLAFTASPGSQPLANSGIATDKFKGIRDLQDGDRINIGQTDRDEGQYRKEGLLWALSKPGSHADPKGINKQAWHKYWVVLDQGRISEYINWKQSLERHMSPIDLRMASVREARAADRRFCFEVITPHFNRVYQGTSEVDMKAWIHAINNALQSAFEGKTTAPDSDKMIFASGSIAKELFGKSSSFHGHRPSSTSIVMANAKSVARHATIGDRPPFSRNRSNDEHSAQLLQTIRGADAGNAWCADCSSESRVEWVSINLGIILCIECSGVHRSLGTHISKIRSLTLDTVSFTQDVVEILLQLGNRVSNMVWEARLDRSLKPGPQASKEQRLSFVNAKYAERAYVQQVTRYSSVDDALLASIKMNDIQNVMHALALKANPNTTDRSRATHAVFLALAAADPAGPALPLVLSSPGQSPAQSSQAYAMQTRKSFPVAELLLQNGGQVPVQASPIPLSKSAIMYLNFKNQQKLGHTPHRGSYQTGHANGDTLTALPTFGGQDQQKLGKRTSTGWESSKPAKTAGTS